ncbi:hypothetical protein BJF78_00465 [Pseudonocardia sp. CNS-139]|nr:hypothetical protein BJF78_00465 [Pseudonocardia sp. CNS-139]
MNPLQRALAVVAAATSLVLTACAATGPASPVDGLPREVRILALSDLTGAASFLGRQGEAGMDLAIEEINAQRFLGDTTLVADRKDVAGKAQTSAAEMSRAVADRGYAAVIGNLTTTVAAPAAPIAQRGGLPFVVGSSSPIGVVLGEYTYLLATPDHRAPPAQRPLPAGARREAARRHRQLREPAAQAHRRGDAAGAGPGVRVRGRGHVVDHVVDGGHVRADQPHHDAAPDAVAIELTGAQSATAIQQLSQRGYTGLYIAQAGVSGGALEPAGAAARGVTWAAPFSPHDTSESTVTYVRAFTAANGGQLPYSASAESYDATWLLARAIKQAARPTGRRSRTP